MSWTDAVLQFWFKEVGPDDWYRGRPEIDVTVIARFGDLRAALKAQPPRADALSAEAHVAAVIVFDQFSRNMFRNTAEAFATDGLALDLARHAVDGGLDIALPTDQRHFLYMPFMHSEDREMQAHSVALFGALGVPDLMDYAEGHKRVVDRFGRFPSRNAALGRASSDAERAYLRDEISGV